MMKHSLILLLFLAIVCASCEGRKSKSVSLRESIEKFNQNHSAQQKITLFPKEYSEVITDSIVSGTFKVHIKNFSHPLATVTIRSTEKELAFHRVFESEVSVSTNKKDILVTHISATHFKNHENDAFWDNATLQHVWVNQELSSESHLNLDISFIDPNANSYKLYRMTIDTQGNYHTYLIEQTI